LSQSLREEKLVTSKREKEENCLSLTTPPHLHWALRNRRTPTTGQKMREFLWESTERVEKRAVLGFTYTSMIQQTSEGNRTWLTIK
jgi:hypothetical protein